MKKLVLPALVFSLLTGCVVGPDYKRPPVTVPEEYRDVQGPPATVASLADRPWWEIFDDDALKQLIDEALRSGYDPQLAAWRVEEARARAGIAHSEFWPQVGYGADWSRNRNSAFVPPYSTETGDLTSVNVNFGWELDLWGRIRRLNEAAKARYLATEDARRGVLLSLVSDVARTYFVLRELDQELLIAKNTVAAFQQTSDLFQRKLAEGAVSALETSYASAALGQVAAQVPVIERRIEETENQLNLLLGRNPDSVPRGQALDAQVLPPEIPAGLPSTLMERRPDIRQAEQELVAANARIGVAVANFFPRIGLTGLFGAVSPTVGELFPDGETWSIGAGLFGPIFQGGRLRRERDVAYAQWEQAKVQYERTVTTAFAETTTVLYAREKIAASLTELTRTVEQYREMVRLTNLRYDSGLSSYFEVLYAMQQLYPAELALARTRADLLIDFVNIYKALGGGWNIQDPNWELPAAAPAPEKP